MCDGTTSYGHRQVLTMSLEALGTMLFTIMRQVVRQMWPWRWEWLLLDLIVAPVYSPVVCRRELFFLRESHPIPSDYHSNLSHSSWDFPKRRGGNWQGGATQSVVILCHYGNLRLGRFHHGICRFWRNLRHVVRVTPAMFCVGQVPPPCQFYS